MINIEATIRWKGYNPNNLKPQSGKYVWTNCNSCGNGRWVRYDNCNSLCRSCSVKGKIVSKETRKKLSEAHSGKNHYGYGRKLSKGHKQKISDTKKGTICSEEHRQKLRDAHKHRSKESYKKQGESLKGHNCSEKTRKKISESNKGKIHSDESYKKGVESRKGYITTEETRKKISESNKGRIFSKNHRNKLSKAGEGRIVSKKTRRRSSATRQGIPYNEWETYAKDKPYCPKFNESCKESNRNKYDNMCFICGLPANKNTTQTGKLWNLSVHHIDMDKNQGCEGIRWKLVPVCIHCHGMIHTELWHGRITYLLNNIIQ